MRIIVASFRPEARPTSSRPDGPMAVGALGQQFVIENRPGAGGNSPPRPSCAPRRTATRFCWSLRRNAINATLYDKLNFDFIRDIAPVAGMAATFCHRGASVAAGQDGSRVHCLCQGQSGQDQHGVGRHWDSGPSVRRVVQDHDWRRYGSCAVSRHTPAITDLIGGQVQVVFRRHRAGDRIIGPENCAPLR